MLRFWLVALHCIPAEPNLARTLVTVLNTLLAKLFETVQGVG